jgi:hypothetical protein
MGIPLEKAGFVEEAGAEARETSNSRAGKEIGSPIGESVSTFHYATA